MATDIEDPLNETQLSRRVKYGLNVGVSALLAIALVALLNWIASRPRNILTLDRTATGQYSLAPQTRKVLSALSEDYTIVTLFAGGNEETAQALGKASDLIDEYARRSTHVKVDHLNPVTDVDRLEEFYNTLRARYADKLAPMKKAVDAGRAVIPQLEEQSKAQSALLKKLGADPAVPDQWAKTISEVDQGIERLGTLAGGVTKQMDRTLTERGQLPNLSAAREGLRTAMDTFETGLYAPAIKQFERAARTDGLQPQVKEELLQLVELFKKSQQTINEALPKLDAAPAVDDYDQLSVQLAGSPNAVVIIGPRTVRVVYLDEMFRTPTEEEVQSNEGRRELSFLGEERVTGALISMNLKAPPLVVFVSAGRPAIGPGGEFEDVADRLRKLNIEVQEWSPSGRPGPMGQMSPPAPPPKPKAGQKAVWIIQPVEAPSMSNPMGGGGERIAPVIEGRLTAGDSAMFMFRFSPGARMGEFDPLAKIVSPWGVKPLQDRIVLQEITTPDRKKHPMPYHTVEQWPKDLPITRALVGMPAIFMYPIPLELTPGKDKGYEQFPLVELHGDDLWAETDPKENVTRDPAKAADHYTIGVAVQSKENRLVVFGEREWATDNVASRAGAAYPGNSELFVNSTLWLAGLDDIIAASARTQDIRRIGPISEGGAKALKTMLVAGMPSLALLAGIGVWLVRRKG